MKVMDVNAVGPRVLHVINSLDVGGAQLVVLGLVASDAGNVRHSIVVVEEPGRLAAEVDTDLVPIHPLGLRPRLLLPLAAARLARIIDDTRPDIVHTHLFPPIYLAAALRRFTRHRFALVHSEQNVTNRRRNYRIARGLEAAVYRQFDRIICVSEAVRDSLIDWVPAIASRTVVIDNASPRSPTPRRAPEWDFVFVGRLVQQKGVDVLLQALHLCQAQGRRVDLCLVGTGAEAGALQQQATRLGVAGSVTFIGEVEVPADYLARARAFVLPSRREGLPLALLEALAMGLPVVATAVGGTPEALRFSRCSALVPADDAAALADAMLRVLDAAPAADGCTEPAFHQRYGVARMVERTVALYQELARARG